MAKQTFAIIGASVAGTQAADTLRREGFEGRVLLIGDEPHRPYDRPPLSKRFLRGEVTADRTSLRPDGYYEDLQIELMLGRRVVALRADTSAVELVDGTTVRADKVLLATGGCPRRLSVPGASLQGVHVLRTIDDAAALSYALPAGSSVVVVGAGFIGTEVAASARQLGCEVTMIEAASMPLGRAVGPEIAERVVAEHRRRGVRLLTGKGVECIVGDRRVRSVMTTDGTALPADVVVIGVGIEPNVELAAGLGLGVGDGVVVDELCTTSNAAVFAAGDVANFPSRQLGRRVRHEQWQHAIDHATAAAKAMLGKGEPYAGVLWFWSDQYDLHLQVAGHPEIADEIMWRGERENDRCCALYLRGAQLVGVVGINRPKDVRAATRLIADGVPVGRDQLVDPAVDLRKVVAAPRV